MNLRLTDLLHSRAFGSWMAYRTRYLRKLLRVATGEDGS